MDIEQATDLELRREYNRLDRILRDAPMALTCGEADQMTDQCVAIRTEISKRAHPSQKRPSGTGRPKTSARRLDRRLAMPERRLRPTCVHCGGRFATFGKLDTHLRFECEVLGRKGAGNGEDR